MGTGSAQQRAERIAFWGFVAMTLGNFMAILDIQIVASSLNQIQAGLSASADELTWVQTSYLIAEVIAIPLSGFLSRLVSTRVYYVASALGFSLASVACAFAWNIESMIVFRAIQGFLGGGMIPTTMGAIFIMFPVEKRTLPIVLVGMVTTLAPALGPTVGGYLTAAFSWHWLFLINLLPGVTIAIVVWYCIHIDKADSSLLKTLDYWGLISMALFLGSLEYVLDEGPRHDWLQDPTVFKLAIVTVLAGVSFFYRVLNTEHPIVQLRVFKDRNFAVGCVVAFVVGVCLFGIVYLVPTFFGQVRGYNSEQIGHVMMFTGIAMFSTAPLVGKLAGKVDLRVLIAYGLGVVALGTYLNSHLTADVDMWNFALPQMLRGHGFMCCMIPMTGLALGTLEPSQVKDGSGVFGLMRNLGGAIGLAVINTLLSDRRAFHYSHLSNAIDPSRQAVREVLAFGQNGLAPQVGDASLGVTLALIKLRIEQQAAIMAFNDMFLLLTGVVSATLVLVLLVQKPKELPPAEAAGH